MFRLLLQPGGGGKRNPSFAPTVAGRGRCPHPQTFFKEKILTKKLFNRLIFVLPRALTFALAKPGVRRAGQDDDPLSGIRAKLVRVKPDKHRPVSAGRGRSCSTLLLGADKRKRGGVFSVNIKIHKIFTFVFSLI
jgi:hypothetical protein